MECEFPVACLGSQEGDQGEPQRGARRRGGEGGADARGDQGGDRVQAPCLPECSEKGIEPHTLPFAPQSFRTHYNLIVTLSLASRSLRVPNYLLCPAQFFMGMVVERIYHFCSEQDAVALMPLLDTGAEVFGQKGNDNIEVRAVANTQIQEQNQTKHKEPKSHHSWVTSTQIFESQSSKPLDLCPKTMSLFRRLSSKSGGGTTLILRTSLRRMG